MNYLAFSMLIIRFRKLRATCMQHGGLISFDESSRNLIHRGGVGFACFEQISVTVEGLGNGRMAHHHLDPLRSESLRDPQCRAGVAQSVERVFGVGLAIAQDGDAGCDLDRPEDTME